MQALNRSVSVIPFPKDDLEATRAAIRYHYHKSVDALAKVGELLLIAQGNLGEASFSSFLDTLPFSRHSAYNFIRLYEHTKTCATVAQANVQLSAWYYAPHGNQELVNKILEKAKTQKVTVADVKALLSSVKFEDNRQQEAWQNAAETNPAFVIESIASGVMDDIHGNAIPIEIADATLVTVNATQALYESVKRQESYIKDKASPKPYTVVTQAEIDFCLKVRPDRTPPALGEKHVFNWYLAKEGE